MKVFLLLLKTITGALSKFLSPLLSYVLGRKSKQEDINEQDIKVLKRQRDNIVSTIDAARDKWMRIRKKHK